MDNIKIGKRIKQARDAKGMSQEDLGDQLGLNKSTIQRYESGQVQRIKLPIVENMAKILGVNPSWIILKSDDPKPYNELSNIAYATDNNSKKQKSEVSAKEFKLLNKYRVIDDHGKRMVDFVLNEEYSRCTTPAQEEETSQPTIRMRCSTYKVSAGRGFELGNGDDWEEIEIPDSPEAQKADFAIEIKGDSMEPVYFNGDIILIKDQDDVDEGEIGVFVLNGDGYIKKKGKRCLISLNDKYDDIEVDEYDDFRCAGKVIGRV